MAYSDRCTCVYVGPEHDVLLQLKELISFDELKEVANLKCCCVDSWQFCMCCVVFSLLHTKS